MLSLLITLAVTASNPVELSAQKLHAAPTLRARLTVQTVGSESAEYRIEMAKPDRLRIEVTGRLIVSDGAQVVECDLKNNTFRRHGPASAALGRVLDAPEFSLVAAFFDAAFVGRFSGFKSAGRKARKGVAYDVTTAIAGTATVSFYIDPSDRLCKVMVEELGERTRIHTLDSLDLGPAIDAGRFAFVPPSGATDLSSDAALKLPREQMPNLYGWKVLPAVGDTSCCPTATANGLAWLSMNGFDGLAKGGDVNARAIAIANELAQVYKTDTTIGTTWDNMFVGLTRCLREKGYPGSKLRFYSWVRSTSWPTVPMGSEMPSLEVLKKAQTRNAFTMLALGWFKRPDAAGRCDRVNWHWATLVDADPGRGTVTLHDPYQRNNPAGRALVLPYRPLSASTKWVLVDSARFKNPDKPVAGVPLLEGYPNVGPNEMAIVEGVLIVEVNP